MADPFNTKGQKPQGQNYGGSQENEDTYRSRDWVNTEQGDYREADALGMLGRERLDYNEKNRMLDFGVQMERGNAMNAAAGLLGENAAERANALGRNVNVANQSNAERVNSAEMYRDQAGQNAQLRNNQMIQGIGYGAGADQAVGNYNSGRGAILGGADQLEGYAQNAASEYQSAAAAQAQADANRTQKNALGVAAGRGASAVRTALAGANASNQQSALNGQAIRAQEANQLNSMRNQAVAQAAGIRSGVGGMDQQAAGLQAQRQQNANAQVAGYQNQLAGLAQANTQAGQQNVAQQGQLAAQDAQMGINTNSLRAGISQNDIQTGMAAQNARAQLAAQNAQVGSANAGALVQSGQQMRQDYLGASTAMEGAKLGADMQNELQRQQWAKENSTAAKVGKGIKMSIDPGGLL